MINILQTAIFGTFFNFFFKCWLPKPAKFDRMMQKICTPLQKKESILLPFMKVHVFYDFFNCSYLIPRYLLT